MLLGRDVHIDLRQIQAAMLDQTIDSQETEVVKHEGIDYLNPIESPGERTGFFSKWSDDIFSDKFQYNFQLLKKQ